MKAFGFSTGELFKLVLLNKDTNTTLNGTVLVKSQLTGVMKCIYMEAPSLSAKDGITIAGYNYIGGNATVNGTFVQKKIQYNHAAEGYQIPIKYAQAVLCETEDSAFKWPSATTKLFGSKLLFSLFLSCFVIFLTISF